MKKGILSSLIACLLFTTGVLAADIHKNFIAKETDYIIKIDGEEQSFSLPVVSIEENTYVAVRQLCEKIGYSVDWYGEERRIELSNNNGSLLPFYEDIYKSQDGALSNGMRFNYIPEESFSCQEKVEQWGATSVKGNYGEVPTAKMAAEIGKNILGYNQNNLDITIQVYFDNEKDAWFVCGLNNRTAHSGVRIAIIRRSDGKIINKYEIR